MISREYAVSSSWYNVAWNSMIRINNYVEDSFLKRRITGSIKWKQNTVYLPCHLYYMYVYRKDIILGEEILH